MDPPSSDDAHPVSTEELARAELALAERVRDGDDGAFAALFRAYYGPLRAFAQGFVGAAMDADDVVHDVFLRIWARRAEWIVTGTVRGYLFGATRNAAVSAVRSRRAEWRWEEAFAREPGPVGIAGPTWRGGDTAVAREVDAAVARAIAGLPEQCRLVYTLRWHHELSYAEIAQALGLSVKTVERHIHRALLTLRRRLAKYR